MSIENFRQESLKYLQTLSDKSQLMPLYVQEIVERFNNGSITSWEAMRELAKTK